MTLDRLWQHPNVLAWLLWPISLIYQAVTALRRLCFRQGWLGSVRLPVPVIVVGNITVGGTGKTPLVIWLVEQLRSRGWKPGVISRGYGGRSASWPRAVTPDSDPREVGDEPVLLAQRLACPVMVGHRRVEVARKLLASHEVNIIVSDDGLQHYALQRDIEVAVVDGLRGFGNGLCLPAGPLRERPARLGEVDLVVINGADGEGIRMDMLPDAVVRLDGRERRSLKQFSGQSVHALAGIGNPARFFATLRSAGLQVMSRSFADHHDYQAADIQFADNKDVIMTEKDAVKCRRFAGPRHWYLEVRARLEPEAVMSLDQLLHPLPLQPRQEA